MPTLSTVLNSLSVSTEEQQVLGLINGSRAYDYDLELEKIAFKHYEFRSGGSPGAEESAYWIRDQFASFGLNASLEPFEFTTWNLTNKPSFIIDDDGNLATTADQFAAETFLTAHLSWPTPRDGVLEDLVILPLPPAADRSQIGLNPINDTAWAVNTTGKVVLTGKELGLSWTWFSKLNQKLNNERPAAVIYTWWYDWMSFTPVMMSSAGGKSYWDWQLPTGNVDYEEGMWIRNHASTINVSAFVSIPAVIGTGTHYNVVGKIDGYKNPEKFVIISSHYDTVMTSGFCDNGAGTAGVIELAKVLAGAVQSGPYRPRYTLVFVTFTDEELWLVGSINYVKQHKSEMPSVVAVINLDCIGSDSFYRTETDDATGIDLDHIVDLAAQDIGISSSVESPGGSDHEVFRDPSSSANQFQSLWGSDPNISDVAPIPSSILLISQPLFYSDKWASGKPGWIHTSYDNSTSTQAHGWVNTMNLQNHMKVAALTIMRVSPSPGIPGDIDYSGTVDLFDALLLANAYGSKPGDSNWDANADIDNSGMVDIFDAIILSRHYGQENP